jgi:hypothetical protein
MNFNGKTMLLYIAAALLLAGLTPDACAQPHIIWSGLQPAQDSITLRVVSNAQGGYELNIIRNQPDGSVTSYISLEPTFNSDAGDTVLKFRDNAKTLFDAEMAKVRDAYSDAESLINTIYRNYRHEGVVIRLASQPDTTPNSLSMSGWGWAIIVVLFVVAAGSLTMLLLRSGSKTPAGEPEVFKEDDTDKHGNQGIPSHSADKKISARSMQRLEDELHELRSNAREDRERIVAAERMLLEKDRKTNELMRRLSQKDEYNRHEETRANLAEASAREHRQKIAELESYCVSVFGREVAPFINYTDSNRFNPADRAALAQALERLLVFAIQYISLVSYYAGRANSDDVYNLQSLGHPATDSSIPARQPLPVTANVASSNYPALVRAVSALLRECNANGEGMGAISVRGYAFTAKESSAL